MKLEVPYSTIVPLRPLIKLRLIGPKGTLVLDPVLVDSGAETSLFPLDDLADVLGVALHERTVNGKPKGLNWRGRFHQLWFGTVELELVDQSGVCAYRWNAEVPFSDAEVPYPLLGQQDCLELFNTDFRSVDQRVDFRAISNRVQRISPTT
jgi:hypothetical protein